MLDSRTAVVGEITRCVLGVRGDAEGFELGFEIGIFHPFGRVVNLLVIQDYASCKLVSVSDVS
jgi:hypothetical protein